MQATTGTREARPCLTPEERQKLTAYAARICGPADAPDCVQKAEADCARTWDPAKGPFVGYCYRAVRNNALRAARSNARRVTLTLALQANPPAPPPLPDQVLAAKQATVMLQAALNSLPLETQAIVLLADIDEVPRAEIAAFLDTSPGAITTELSRARRTLREALRELEADTRIKKTAQDHKVATR